MPGPLEARIATEEPLSCGDAVGLAGGAADHDVWAGGLFVLRSESVSGQVADVAGIARRPDHYCPWMVLPQRFTRPSLELDEGSGLEAGGGEAEVEPSCS